MLLLYTLLVHIFEHKWVSEFYNNVVCIQKSFSASLIKTILCKLSTLKDFTWLWEKHMQY